MEQTNILSKDAMLAEVIAMGFEFGSALEAVEAVGQSVNDAVDFILSGNPGISRGDGNNIKNGQTNLPNSHSREEVDVRKNIGSCSGFYATRQSLITEKFKPTGRHVESVSMGNCKISSTSYAAGNDARQLHMFQDKFCGTDPLEDTELNWEQKAEALLQQRFGYKELKCFQKEALKAWAGHQDCLVLAATGSGKSICFQLPALLTGKVVVVVSPLISLMHDQCLKLARHGVSACFLGSGQIDKSIEDKAMAGMYDIIYVCPETLLRVVGSIQKLAESRGIALFAIDEVHCVSKWGHDFRPDYRRLSVLREKFQASNIESAKHHIPIMALTATATLRVRADIMSSLGMKADTKIVLTSFFRPNLRFSVHHSQTSRSTSYKADFQELIDTYAQGRSTSLTGKNNKTGIHFKKDQYCIDRNKESARKIASDSDETSSNESDSYVEEIDDHDLNAKTSSINEDVGHTCEGHKMTVEYLEDEADERMAEDFDVTFGEFKGSFFKEDSHLVPESGSFETVDQSVLGDEHTVLGLGPSIIYTPTRKETEMLAKFLIKSGVKAAAYHAKLPKKHLRQVHEQFHHDKLQVVVATIAFGMGIDKANVRRIIHYGWPQSLESYYQEAGRAGRDGLLADCSLYVNMKRLPSLLPSRRNAEQTQNALNMLSECFRYGVSTTCCRAKTLVKYFGEDLIERKCGVCDVCVNGPPNSENLSKEAGLFLRVLVELQTTISYRPSDVNNKMSKLHNLGRCSEMVPFSMVIQRLTEQHEGRARNSLWWRGFVRVLQDIDFIRDGNDVAVQNQRRVLTVKYPEPTVRGIEFLKSCNSPTNLDGVQTLYLFPEGDMLQAMKTPELSFKRSEWGRGWADPEIRQQRLKGRKGRGKKRKRVSRKSRPDSNTVRGRLSAKLSRKNH